MGEFLVIRVRREMFPVVMRFVTGHLGEKMWAGTIVETGKADEQIHAETVKLVADTADKALSGACEVSAGVGS
jgi:hypothetical protein